MTPPDLQDIISELVFTSSRSSGAGGQNVNKVNSKVTMRWNVKVSPSLSSEQKEWILQKLANQLTNSDELIISSQEHRSQIKNKEEVIHKLKATLALVFKRRKTRKASKPSKAALARRLENKRKHSDKKQLRKRIG